MHLCAEGKSRLNTLKKTAEKREMKDGFFVVFASESKSFADYCEKHLKGFFFFLLEELKGTLLLTRFIKRKKKNGRVLLKERAQKTF